MGTRPEIIKNLAFCRAAKSIPGLKLDVLFTGQNFGPEMSSAQWKQLGIPITRVSKGVDRTSTGAIARDLMDFVTESIRLYKPDAVISNTDTDTAFYTALAAAKAKVPVVHIEGGIRCEARLNPEELNRRLADHLATWVFVISPEDERSLLDEGFDRDRVFNLGDITNDALKIVIKEHKIPIARGGYDLLTVHRQENVGDPKRLAAILEGVRRAGFPTRFPVHPRTRQALERGEAKAILKKAPNITLLPPQPYLDLVRLLAGCRKLVSDSGGLRREGYLLDKPVISLVWFVWFKGMNRLGFEKVADADATAIEKALRTFDPKGKRPPLFGDGRAGERILRKTVQLLARRSR